MSIRAAESNGAKILILKLYDEEQGVTTSIKSGYRNPSEGTQRLVSQSNRNNWSSSCFRVINDNGGRRTPPTEMEIIFMVNSKELQLV